MRQAIKKRLSAITTRRRHRRKKGTLIIIGGAEDKTKDRVILKEIVQRTGPNGKIVIITAASEIANRVWEDYCRIFTEMGIKKLEHLYVEQPEDARDPSKLKIFDGANTIFFTGGDQLKITTKLGGTDIVDRIFEIYKNGGTIAGTSAGASIMGKTMLVGGENAESHKVGNWMMAPGLGFIEGMLIDQHFGQRGRIGRLLGAVALNPGILGIGVDEDTAIIVENNRFKVIGNNAVYILDGRTVSYTNISEASAEKTMSIHDVKLHVLAENEKFHVLSHRVELQREAS
jgi:cyanophycinase